MTRDVASMHEIYVMPEGDPDFEEWSKVTRGSQPATRYKVASSVFPVPCTLVYT